MPYPHHSRRSRPYRAGRFARRHRTAAIFAPFIILLILIGIVTAIAFATGYYDSEPVTVKISEKESINKGGSAGHEYRVYTDQGTFVMEDTWIKGRFDTADEYGAIQEGRTYDCTTYGWRVPLFSMFQNLMDCKEAS